MLLGLVAPDVLRERLHPGVLGQQPGGAVLLRRRHEQLLRRLQPVARRSQPGLPPPRVRRGSRQRRQIGRLVLPDLRGDGVPRLAADDGDVEPDLRRQLGHVLEQQQRRVLAVAVQRRRQLERRRDVGLRVVLAEGEAEPQLRAAVRRARPGGRGRRGADADGVAQERDEARPGAREPPGRAVDEPAQAAFTDDADGCRRADDRLRPHFVR